MKLFRSFITILATLGLLLLALPAKSQPSAGQYGILGTHWNMSIGTNNPAGGTSNLASVVSCTKFDNFALVFTIITTNIGTAGTLDVQWDTSLDGTTWATYPGKPGGMPAASGWFGVPCSNSVINTFTTNITLNSVGYFRINWVTNQTGQHITNAVIRSYAKPKYRG